MGMDSGKLRVRKKHPGHDTSYRKSEENFVKALKLIVSPNAFEVVAKPRELRKILGGYGIVPEVVIRHRKSGRVMYFEVKKQGKAGNADERAAKHHTKQFYKVLRRVTKMRYHAYRTIFCESLAKLPKYRTKIPFFFEKDHFLFWEDYRLKTLSDYLKRVVLPLLRGQVV
jgi:hypothetical protein